MPRRARTVTVGLATGAALALTTGLAAAAPPGVGAPGIGDPYYPDYGNGGYDVAHYDIGVTYDVPTDRLTGRTTITATATQTLQRFDLDLVLAARTVTVNGRKAAFRQRPHELVVTPARALAKGDPMTVTVTYAGVPSAISDDGISPWIRTADGAAAVGEPEIAAWWYPSNDHPRDKATFDVSVTTRKSLEVLGNGVLVSNAVKGANRTWHWRENRPMAPYLAFFVVGQFDITKGRTANGMPVVTAVASNGGSEGRYAAADLARTPEIIDWEASHYGPYPFDALGGVAPAADFGFALENQTRPVYTRGFWSGGPNIYVVVHELAHQWYGDSVSVHDWKDIWLNEGFASFTEWLWSEEHGEGSAADIFAAYWDFYRDDAQFWTLPIGNPGAHHEFEGPVYDRGAMALQALRTRIGESAFSAVMRTWAYEHRYGNGTIAQFVELANGMSGQNLGSFFQAWLYARRAPAPTRSNGFPPGLRDGATARAVPTPASFATIRKATALLSAAERRAASR